MNKMKRTRKKEKGLEARIMREKFLQELKNPTLKSKHDDEAAQEILRKIRDRARMGTGPKPYKPSRNTMYASSLGTGDSNKIMDKIKEELADILIYAISIANKTNIDISEIIQEKLIVNAKKYPVSTSKGSNKKYREI